MKKRIDEKSAVAVFKLPKGGGKNMLSSLRVVNLFVALAVATVTNVSVGTSEEVGTSAVPYMWTPPPPSRPRPPAQNRRPQDQAAAHRARWPSYTFPAPNAGLLVFTIMPNGNPACASYDASGCLWGLEYAQIDFKQVRPLVCGQEHRSRWGVTGYEDARHWCSMARSMRAHHG